RSTVDLQLSVTPVASDYRHYTYTVPDCQYVVRIFTCQSSADSVVQATILAQVRLEQEARKPLLSLHNVNRVQAVFHAQVAVSSGEGRKHCCLFRPRQEGGANGVEGDPLDVVD